MNGFCLELYYKDFTRETFFIKANYVKKTETLAKKVMDSIPNFLVKFEKISTEMNKKDATKWVMWHLRKCTMTQDKFGYDFKGIEERDRFSFSVGNDETLYIIEVK